MLGLDMNDCWGEVSVGCLIVAFCMFGVFYFTLNTCKLFWGKSLNVIGGVRAVFFVVLEGQLLKMKNSCQFFRLYISKLIEGKTQRSKRVG